MVGFLSQYSLCVGSVCVQRSPWQRVRVGCTSEGVDLGVTG